MKLVRVESKNYRLLKNFSIDLENELSLIVGKNNTGKTSLLSLLERFLHGDASRFAFDDFNLDTQKELAKLVNAGDAGGQLSSLDLSLTLSIAYDETDNLSNISRFMVDLEPESRLVCLHFRYFLPLERFTQLTIDYAAANSKEEQQAKKAARKAKPLTVSEFLGRNYKTILKSAAIQSIRRTTRVAST